MRKLIAGLCLAATSSLAWAEYQAAVTRAYADTHGRVHIVTADGRDHGISPEKGQNGVEKIQVAPDGKTIGWLVDLWASCCVSYPISFELVVWQSGHIIRRVHPSMAIWSFAFVKNGAEIAYRNSPLHGGWSGECVLVDIASGKTLASWDHPIDENGNDTDDNSDEPGWAKQLQ
ncbi:MAG TPA: hypothetical protein VGE83_10935 [Terracidiphilus sp.]